MKQLFEKLLERYPNIIESPFLIWEMLTMLRVGLQGETARELDKFLQLLAVENGITEKEFYELSNKYFLPPHTDLANQTVLHQTSSQINGQEFLSKPDTIANDHKNEETLCIANRIFINHGTRLNENFTNVLRDKYACGAQELDFGMPQQAVDSINNWVKDATNERITSILSSHDIGAKTQAILANAIYFKGQWMQQFEPADTKLKPFYINAEQCALVPMMSQTMNARYAFLPCHNVQVLELPYRHSDLAMLVILPTSIKTDLSGVASLRLKDLVKDLTYLRLHINLPKFTFGCTINVHDILQELGVHGIFHSSQDFSDLVGDSASDFSVSKIIQQAFIKVTEEGTEAAAATACCIDGALTFDEKFIANRPFYFCIKNINCVKLFEGCYRKPSEA